MIRRVETEAVEPLYLAQLNACFPGWGGKAMFDWCFRRRAGGPPADLFVAAEGGRLIAGTAVTYRRALRAGCAAPEMIACMTGSWTDPAARGRGLFKAMIEAARAQAAARGCALLIAFATEANASARALQGAGATVLPTAYLATARVTKGSPIVPLDSGTAAATFMARDLDASLSRLLYERDEWCGQMLHRPQPVETIAMGDTAALIERGAAANRLLDVATADPVVFARVATGIARVLAPLLAFTLDPDAADRLEADGFSRQPGGLHLLTTSGGQAPRERWWFANGDRM
jgi:GNAT superfamily N-acetyltransferase